MTTNQMERVSDEELDQMIWKLERDGGMTPKMLSLMRELREVRRVNGEPVAYAVSNDFWNQGNHKRHIDGKLCDLFFPGDTFRGKELKPGDYDHVFPLYSAPQPLSDAERAELQEHRAATPNHSGDTADMGEPVSNREELIPGIKPAPDLDSVAKNAKSLPGNSPATSDAWIPVSERMPPEGTPLLVCSSNGYVERTVYGFDGENWFDWNEQYVQVKTDPDELWQLLPAAPKEVG